MTINILKNLTTTFINIYNGYMPAPTDKLHCIALLDFESWEHRQKGTSGSINWICTTFIHFRVNLFLPYTAKFTNLYADSQHLEVNHMYTNSVTSGVVTFRATDILGAHLYCL